MKILAAFFVSSVLACAELLLGQADVRPSTNVVVTIIPAKATLFAGETVTFVAIVVGVDNKAVNWSLEERDGGAITDLGQYTAPKIQGVYHIAATSRAKPDAKSVATVTVFTYCDPLPASFRH